jgi:hypothetical protein
VVGGRRQLADRLAGSVAFTLSLCITVQSLYTIFTNIFGSSVYEPSMRRNPIAAALHEEQALHPLRWVVEAPGEAAASGLFSAVAPLDAGRAVSPHCHLLAFIGVTCVKKYLGEVE